jgi:lysophospholipase L1-like esterase
VNRRTLLKAGIAGAVAALAPRPTYATPHPILPPLVICEGNSTTDTRPLAVSWHEYLQAMPAVAAYAPAVVNVALRGEPCTNLVAMYPQRIAPLLAGWPGQRIVVLWEGTNDLASRRGDVAASWQVHADYCDEIRRAGAQVVLGTIMPRDVAFGFDFEAARLAWNELARREWRAHADALMDVGADGRLKPGPLFMDHSHPTSAGNEIIASIAAASILPLLQMVKPAAVQARPASCLAFPLVGR